MHGKKREEYKAKQRDPKVAAKLEEKAEQWYVLMNDLQHRRRRFRSLSSSSSSSLPSSCRIKYQQEQRQRDDMGVSNNDNDNDNDNNNNDSNSDVNNVVGSSSRSTSCLSSMDIYLYNAQTLELLEKVLMVNPDPMNLWNQRREILMHQQQQQQQVTVQQQHDSNDKKGDQNNNDTDNDNNHDMTVLERERGLTQAALKNNPKAYGPWFHRKWTIQWIIDKNTGTNNTNDVVVMLREELQLTVLFLSADERNFHCWNYRRFIVACLAGSMDGRWIMTNNTTPTTNMMMGPQLSSSSSSVFDHRRQQQQQKRNVPELEIYDNNNNNNSGALIKNNIVILHELIQSEFDFTTTKIHDNFSNFSALHYRSQLLDHYYYHTIQNGNTTDQHEKNNNYNGNDNNENLTMPMTMTTTMLEQMMEDEFQLIENGICTEPDDQSMWWYHGIFLDKLLSHSRIMHSISDATTIVTLHDNDGDNNNNGSSNSNSNSDVLSGPLRRRLEGQVDLFRELLEDSPESKWVLLGMFRVLQILISSRSIDDDDDERKSLLERLRKIDSDRSKYYEHLLQKLLQNC